MSDPRSDELVREYLRRLDQQLAQVPKERRTALREQIESHIRDARSEIPDDDPDLIAEVLMHLGDPTEISSDGSSEVSGRRGKAWTWTAIGVVGAVALTALFVAVGNSGPGRHSPATLVAPTSYTIPILVGHPLDNAMTQLSNNSMLATCKPALGLRKFASVTGQSPSPSTTVKPGSDVSLTVVRGNSTNVTPLGVPITLGFQVSCAVLLLDGAHVDYHVQWVIAPAGFPTDAVTAEIKVHDGVLLRVARATSSTHQSSVGTCTRFQPWAFEGATILAQESARNADGWAYGSVPQDIHGNGSYVFYFGPVPSDFVWGKHPSGFAVQGPPDFSAGGFLFPTAGKLGVVTLHGQRYFRVPERIARYGPHCSGLVLWAY